MSPMQTIKQGLKTIPCLGPLLVSVNRKRRNFFSWTSTNRHAVIHSLSGFNRFSVYLGNNRALTRTIFGHKIFVDTQDISLTPHILMDGYWEKWITTFFTGLLKEGMQVVEIGTNIGYYTQLAASKIGTRGKLYAFEANPEIFDLLFQNMAVNGFLDRVVLVNKAVADSTKRLQFNTLLRHKGSSSIGFFPEEFLNQYHDQVKSIEIEAVSLDDFFGSEHPHIDLIKIDAEGSEPFIARGMDGLLSKNPAVKIVCEFAPDLIRGAGEDPVQFLQFFLERDFKLYLIDTDSQAKETSLENLLKIPHCDLLICRTKPDDI